MSTITGYLKWANVVIGEIINHNTVRFIRHDAYPESKSVIDYVTGGKEIWNEDEYSSFLEDRIVSRGRRDIEKILARLGLVEYDAIKIAEKTHALNPKDLFWVSDHVESKIESITKDVFTNIFKMKIEAGGASFSSPDGQNVKDYGISEGQYGILKRRIHGVATDAESEVAVYKLGKLLGVPVCPAWFVDTDTTFSRFMYDFTREFLVHVRRFFAPGELHLDRYPALVGKFPDFKEDIARMCLLDFITRQDDRHLSNMAVLFTDEGKKFYPLYDNGRSLFFEDREETVHLCLKDIALNSTSFGEIGTYHDVIKRIAQEHDISKLINLEIADADVYEALQSSRFNGYRLEGARKWVMDAIHILKSISRRHEHD